MAYPYTYSSVTYNSPAGAVDITITIPDGVGITETANREFYLIDIGDIEFKSDVPTRSENEATSIGTEQGKFKIKVWDTFKDTSISLFQQLIKIEANTFLNVDVTVGANEFVFVLEQGNINYNQKDNFTEITFTPNVKYQLSDDGITTATSGLSLSVPQLKATMGALIPSYPFVDGGVEKGLEYVRMESIIRYGLLSIFGQSTASTNYIISSPNVLINASLDEGRLLNRDFVSTNNFPVAYLEETNDPKTYNIPDLSVLQTIARFAASIGCYFGYAFGVSYFIYRLDTSDVDEINGITTKVAISYSNVLELRQIYNLEPINSITNSTLNYTNSIDNNTGDPLSRAFSDSGREFDINRFATQKYNITFNAYSGMGQRNFSGGILGLVFPTSGATTDLCLIRGSLAYEKSLAFIKTRQIEFKLRGFDSIKPYQTFTWDSATPDNFEKAEDGTTTAIYRPSSIKYNAKEDIITVKAYLIN